MGWIIGPDQLDEDQRRIVQRPPTDNLVVVGDPGSGKTLIAAHRTQYLASTFNLYSSQYAMFIYTTLLRDYIKSGLIELGIPDDSVVHGFLAWCMRYHNRQIGSIPKQKGTPVWDQIRENVHNHVMSNGQKMFKFVVVDEAQDLYESDLNIIYRIADHVTLLMDENQSLYPTGMTLSKAKRALRIRNEHSLLKNYRNMQHLTKVAARFTTDKRSRDLLVRRAAYRMKAEYQMDPVFFECNRTDDQVEAVVSVLHTLRTNQYIGSIGILLPHNHQVSEWANRLEMHGITTEWQVHRDSNIEFESSLPKIMTLHQAKGLSLDAVIMPDFVDSHYGRWDAEEKARLIFVGITRAVRYFCLVGIHGQNAPFQHEFDEAVGNGELQQISFTDGAADSGYIEAEIDDDDLPF